MSASIVAQRREILGVARGLLPAGNVAKPLRVLEVLPSYGLRSLTRLAEASGGFGAFARGVEAVLASLAIPESWLEDRTTSTLVEMLGGRPMQLTLVSPDPRALRVAQAGITGAVHTVLADPLRADTQAGALRGAFDVVVAFGVLEKLDDTQRLVAAHRISGLARRDGLILEDSGRLATAPEVSLAARSNVYRKR